MPDTPDNANALRNARPLHNMQRQDCGAKQESNESKYNKQEQERETRRSTRQLQSKQEISVPYLSTACTAHKWAPFNAYVLLGLGFDPQS